MSKQPKPENARAQLIKGGLVVDPVARSAEIRDILVVGGKLQEIGPPGLAAPDDARIIEAAGFIVMPGLVNAHTHSHHALGKGRADRWALDVLLVANPWIAGGLTLEDKQLCGQLNAAEMVLKGTTAAYDLFFELPLPSADGMAAVARGYGEVGVKAVIAPMMADVTYYRAIPGLIAAFPEAMRGALEALTVAPFASQLDACRAIFENWPLPREAACPALGPTIPLHCSEGFLTGCRDLAEDYDLGLQTHLSEAKFQVIAGLKRYDKTLTGHLDDLGLVTERFSGAHGVWLDGDDIKLLADKGAAVAHNPGSNMRLGSGIAPARALLDAGVELGIGTDGSACSDSQNMFEAMRAASHVSRIVDPDPDNWLSTWEILHAATAASARVLRQDDRIGRLAPGYQADLVFLDRSNVNYVPLNDAANQIVNCEDSSAVTHVMIDGELVLEDRRFTRFDYDDLKARAQAAADRLSESNQAARAQIDILSPFVARHCQGLASQHYHVTRRIERAL
jgi:guanine deaminase